MADKPVIANLDFEDVKSDLVNYFKSRDEFTDYEFTGSALNLLMDILVYNTHYYSLASNFLQNESFLDTAIIRKNVISLAKRLNYTPKSISSARTKVQLSFTKIGSDDRLVLVPAGSLFKASVSNSTLNFSTIEDYVVQFNDTELPGTVKTIEVDIYEGTYQTQAFTSSINYDNFSYWNLPQENIDTSTISVSVNGVRYDKITPEDENLFSIGSLSNVYFLEENRDGGYDIVLGNGVAGKAVSSGDQILVSYLSSNGADGNGVKFFTPIINGRTDATIQTTPEPTQGGSDRESIQEIKDNAPKWFQSQYRAVTGNDYEVILKNKFADIQAISVWQADENQGVPGKVYISIKPKSADTLTSASKQILRNEILGASNIITIKPEFVDPDIFDVVLKTVVVYDDSKLSSNPNILKARVSNLYSYLNDNYIGEFLKSFRESKVSREIKDLDPSIVSSNTRVQIRKQVSVVSNKLSTYEIDFNNVLYHPEAGFKAATGGILSSSLFTVTGNTFKSGFDDDGNGNIRLFNYVDNTKVYTNTNVGVIDYNKGTINITTDLSYDDSSVYFTVIPDSVDVLTTRQMILRIAIDESLIDVVEQNDLDILKSINLSRST